VGEIVATLALLRQIAITCRAAWRAALVLRRSICAVGQESGVPSSRAPAISILLVDHSGLRCRVLARGRQVALFVA
jgi:hypothetical protein